MELRSPKPFTSRGSNDFNADCVAVLRNWGILLDSVNPVARTDVAPIIWAPAEPSLYGLSFTNPAAGASRTFLVAGAGELPDAARKVQSPPRRLQHSPGR